ncbi:MAG: alpha-amlyase, partial [Bacteroidetes bacterium]|nr:alpha-amlyase [Bacteroidota bacterium]
IDGIRMDTYPYPEKYMMARWAKRVTDEFPGFFIVGEVWFEEESLTAYWALNKINPDGYESHLPSVTDFPLSLSTHRAFTEADTWTEGIARIYLILSQDFIYPNPASNVIFLDNHDLTRYFTQVSSGIDIYKMALAFILTTRGIPQFYYGTEILMQGEKARGDGYLREDFPGGWPGDSKNAFTGTGLTEEELEALEFCTRLLNWRKEKDVIHYGKLKHYIPENGLYVYFRYNEMESVMIVLNNNPEKAGIINPERYMESLVGFKSGYDLIGESPVDISSGFTIGPKKAMIIELKK